MPLVIAPAESDPTTHPRSTINILVAREWELPEMNQP